MSLLRAWLERTGTSDLALARRAGLSKPMINQIKSGRRRPSPEAAKRIESATDGEVRAAGLLGLEEAGAPFDHETSPRPISGGRWSVRVAADGTLHLSKEMMAALGFSAGERLLFAPDGDSVRVHSTDRALKVIQAEVRARTPEGVSLADELIAARRLEAKRD